MDQQADFKINSTGPVSREFTRRHIFTFQEATEFLRLLPYGRNADKKDVRTLFEDKCGTCSTKHGLLKILADENKFEELELVLGIFRMNKENTPLVAKTLKMAGLTFIPEAHNYLIFKNQILDYTHSHSKPSDFAGDLMEEKIIEPDQISDFKVAYHKDYLRSWLKSNQHLKYSVEELWEVREQCIKDLTEGALFISRPS